MCKTSISIKLITKERAKTIQNLLDAGVNISQYLRNCIDNHPLNVDRKREVNVA